MLNFKSGKPIAAPHGTKENRIPKIIYINSDDDSSSEEMEDIDYLCKITPRQRACPICGATFTRSDNMRRHLQSAQRCTNRIPAKRFRKKTIRNKFYDIVSEGRGFKEARLKEGKMFPLPNTIPGQRDVYLIVGPSGSGKSTFVNTYANRFSTIFPDKKIFLFSEVDEDDSINFDPLRLHIKEKDVDHPIELDELKDSLVIFDDIKTSNPKIRQYLQNLMDRILLQGRSHNKESGDGIYCLVTVHQLFGYNETKRIMDECNHFVWFPKSGSINKPFKYLKDYIGVDRKVIERMKSCPSRWVCVHKNYPMYSIYENGIFLHE